MPTTGSPVRVSMSGQRTVRAGADPAAPRGAARPRHAQAGASWAARSAGSVTGRSQTNPRHTYAAGAPPTSGRLASSGTPGWSGSPATTTAPAGASRTAVLTSSSRAPAGPTTATSTGP